MSDKDQKIEIELALQDQAAVSVIQSIGKNVGDAVKAISEMGKASDGTDSGIKKTIEGAKKLKDNANESNKSFNVLLGILTRLAGPTGVAIAIGTGLVAAALALDALAGKRLRLENLATDLGMTTDQMSIMSRTFEKLLGSSSEDATNKMITIATVLRNIQTYGESNPVFRALSEMGRGDFARRLVETAKAADGVWRSFELVNAEYNKILTQEGPRAAAIFLDTISKGWDLSIAQGFAKAREGVKPARQVDLEIAAKFRQNKQDLEESTMDFLARWQEFFQLEANEFTDIYRRLMGMDSGAWHGILGGVKSLLDPGPLADPLLLDPPSALKRKDHRFEWEKEEEETKKDTNSTLERMRDSIKRLFGAEPKQYGGSVEWGKNYFVGEEGPEVFQGGGKTQIIGEDGPGIYRPNVSGGIIPSSRIEDRRGDPVPPWWMNTWKDIQDFRHNNPVAKRLYGEDYRLNDLHLPLAEHKLGDPTNDPAEIWSTENYNQFLRGETPGSAPGRIRSLSGSAYEREQRHEIDIMLHKEEAGSPSLDADITFRNVPPGVTTKADGEGFDNFKVNKSKSLEGM
jgi:hypothetical protein